MSTAHGQHQKEALGDTWSPPGLEPAMSEPRTGSSEAAESGLERPMRWVRLRLRRWFEARLPYSDSVTLTQRNVYILPTRPGMMLGVTLMVLLTGSINYQLNLGYLLTFLLAGSALVGMHLCHATLRGISMHLAPPAPCHAHAAALIDVQLTNMRRSVRYGIGLSVMAPPESRKEKDGLPHWVWTDVPARGSCVARVAFTPARRGLYRVPTLTAETRFPLGTFRVWTVWRPAAQLLVYPAPEPNPPPWPPGEPRTGGALATARARTAGEFDGIRGYRRGDPMKLIVWKKATNVNEQGNGLVVRDTHQAQRYELWLDFMQAGAADTEHKLSRLCAWILQLDKLGLDYGLRLPRTSIAPASGEAHKRQCLEALALC